MATGAWRVEHVPDKQIAKRKKICTALMDESESFSETSTETTGQPSNLVELSGVLSNLATSVAEMRSRSVPKVGSECIPNFDPQDKNQNINKWINKVEELKNIYKWDELTLIFYITTRLRGLATVWYQSLPSLNFTWEEWKVKLRAAFPVQIDYASQLKQMLKRVKEKGEDMLVYYYEKLALLNSCEIYGKNAVSCIIEGIPDLHTQSAAKVGDYPNPEALLKFLKTLHEDKVIIRMPQTVSKYQGPIKRSYNDQPSNDRRKCYGCGSRNHILSYCPTTTRNCRKCGSSHKGDCRQEIKLQSKQVLVMEKETNKGNKYFVNALINGMNLRVFVDFGAGCNTLKEEMFSALNMTHDAQEHKLRGFGGGVVKSLGTVKNVEVVIDRVKALTDFLIVPDSVQKVSAIIGQPFTEQPHVLIIKDSECLRMYENNFEQLPSVTDIPQLKTKFWIKDTTVVPPRHVQNVKCNAQSSGEFYLESSIRMKENNEYCLPRCIIKVDNNGECVIPVMNPTDKEVIVKSKQVFARGRESNTQELWGIENSSNSLTKFEELQIGSNLSPEERLELMTLLQKYRKCFATTINEIGCTSAAELHIELDDVKPVMYKPYRMNPSSREKVKEIVDELLECNIVRESNSPFASPVLLVQKKNGEQRLCIDYRKLNSKIKQDRFPLPRIDDQLDQLHGYNFFTTLDMTSGYYQIPISENSKHITSFITPDGQYEFNRMPFGISVAPSVFQRMVNKILGPLRGTIAMAYLDDILIPSKDFKQGLERLNQILNVIDQYHLTLNPRKCNFFATSLHYLDYEIS